MSVNINWNSLEQESIITWSKKLLNDALNSGKRPSILAADIEIKDLNFGHNAPIVEILEIGDLDNDTFRGIFKIKYTGDSYINLATKIQANPMNVLCNNQINKFSKFTLPDLSNVNQSFKIPINLKLSKIILSGIIIIVFNKSKGLTLVFKNDPLENINVSSTFDTIPAIRNFLQLQIENQIRDLFREILPNVLYQVSQKWTQDIHSQLHGKDHSGSEKVNTVLLSEINPDGPDLSPANLLRISTLCASRQSLSLSAPVIKDFIQRSMVEKYLNDNALNSNQSYFLMMNKFSKDFNNVAFKNKCSNSLPIELFTNNNVFHGEEYTSIEKTITDVSKYQAMSYNNKNQSNTQLKKPRRRVVKLGKKVKSSDSPADITHEETSVANDSVTVDLSSGSFDDTDASTLVMDDDEDLSMMNLSIDSIPPMKNKRALSSSSAGVEYLRSLVQKDIKNGIKEKVWENRTAKKSEDKTVIKKSEYETPLKKSIFRISLGLNGPVMAKNQVEADEMASSSVRPSSLKLNISKKLAEEVGKHRERQNYNPTNYYKRFSNLKSEKPRLPGIEFFSSNPILTDIPPPYVP